MRWQGYLCLLVLLVTIYEHQCAESDPERKPNVHVSGHGSSFQKENNPQHGHRGRRDGNVDWNYSGNYYNPTSYDMEKKNRPYNRKSPYDDRDDYSHDRRPSYKDDPDSYERGSSYKDDDYDRDDRPSGYRSRGGRKSPKNVGHMNIYFREPSGDGKRRKPKRMRFPTARYDRDDFPLVGPFINFLPWLPIFADRFTKQTIIFSPIGGVYIIPPLINFYGEMFSVAELIASGYASLVSTGVPPPPAVDVAPLVQPAPVVGPGIPAISPATGGFSGGIRTEFRHFERPNYPKEYIEKPAYHRGEQYVKPAENY